MKIIGQAQDTLILEASKREIARLIGYYYQGDGCPALVPGMAISVNSMYEQLYELARNKQKLNNTAEDLETLASKLRLLNPVVEAALIGGDDESL